MKRNRLGQWATELRITKWLRKKWNWLKTMPHKINNFVTGIVWERTWKISVLVVAMIASGTYFEYANSTPTALAETKIVTVQTYKRAPVQDRIAGCESVGNRNSKGKQFDAQGRLYKHVNTNGTIDFGKNGINAKVWEMKAIELGYNIYTEEGNDKMADWIYQNRGTQDWYSSEACWK